MPFEQLASAGFLWGSRMKYSKKYILSDDDLCKPTKLVWPRG